MFSKRTTFLNKSATLAMNALSKERQKQGLPVFNLSTGEPDLPTPEHIKSAAKEAIDQNFTQYTAAGGIPELKQAIQLKFKRDNGLDFTLPEITTANGGKQILYNLFQVLLDEGDEVLCFSPYWLSYRTQVELAGAKLIEIGCENFKPRAEKLIEAIGPKCKIILINSPANPSGAIIDEADLKLIGKAVLGKNIMIVSDEVYEFFYYTSEKPKGILELMPELKAQTIIVNSVSKSYAMTGWRLGYAAGPAEIIDKMEELQGHSSSNASSISQKASIAALAGPQDAIEMMRQKFIARRQKLIEKFSAPAAKIKLIVPEGAFYALLDVSKLLNEHENTLDFCMKLISETGVVAVPGSPFGENMEKFIRISFAVKDDVLESALEALGKL
mgnify:CR=1 FL=1